MAWFASARDRNDTMSLAASKLVAAMHTHPDLVAGEKRACTELMCAMNGVVVKTGAEGVFVAILPKQKLGIALKIADGTTRAANALIAQLLVRFGALDADHPATRRRVNAPILNRRKIETGVIQCTEILR
jgi:L-asparaginase II